MALLTLLDNVTGVTNGSATKVEEGRYMVFIDGTTTGTITLECSIDDQSSNFQLLDGASYTNMNRRIIDLPDCYIRGTADGSTVAITLRLISNS